MGSGWKEEKARLRHRGTLNGVTEVLIDRIDQDKKRKVIDYLRSINYEPLTEGEEPLIYVDVSTLDSKQVCQKIVSFMHTVGVDEVSVSSARFNDTLPEIEDSLTERDFTLADSEDIRRIADKIEKGQESEFELIVSNPEQIGFESTRWTSKNIIKSLAQKRIDSALEEQQSEVKENSIPSPINLPKPNWWVRKKKKFWTFFTNKRKRNKPNIEIVNRMEFTQTNTSTFQKKFSTLGNIIKTNQNNFTEPTKKNNKNRIIYSKHQERLITKKINQVLKRKIAKKIKLEAYTQTEGYYKNFINAKNQTGNNTMWENTSSACCDCINSHYTETMIRPQVINYPDVMNPNLPYYMNPIARNPIFYVIPQDPFYQQQNYTVSCMGQGIPEDGRSSFTTNSTSRTNNMFVKKKKKIYKEKSCSSIKKQSDIKSNKSTQNGTWSTKLYQTKSDHLSSDSQRFTPSRLTLTTCDANSKKIERIHNLYTTKNGMKIRNDIGDVPSNESVQQKQKFEKQLADIQNKLEQITNFQKDTKEKVNTAVDCCDLSNPHSRLVRTADIATQIADTSNQKIINDKRYNNLKKREDKYVNTEDDNSLEKDIKEIIINLGNYVSDTDYAGNGISRKTTRFENKPEKTSNERHKRRSRNEEVDRRHMPLGLDRYSYKEHNDPGLVLPKNTWEEEYRHGLSFMADYPRCTKKRKPRSRCKKWCRIFSTGKKKHLKEQLMHQKLDLLQLRAVLNEINYGVRREDESELQYLPLNKNYNKENEDDSNEDIQFSISRPKGSKKCVTFKTPLTD